VNDAPMSYRAHQIFGAWLFAAGYKGEGEKELWKAIRLFPYDPVPSFLMAEEYRKNGACDRAIPLYRWALATTDSAANSVLGPFAKCLLQLGQVDSAHAIAMRGVERDQDLRVYRWLLHRIDSVRAVVRSGGPVGPMPRAWIPSTQAASNQAGVVRQPSQNAAPARAADDGAHSAKPAQGNSLR
jgi:hypothetical protein